VSHLGVGAVFGPASGSRGGVLWYRLAMPQAKRYMPPGYVLQEFHPVKCLYPAVNEAKPCTVETLKDRAEPRAKLMKRFRMR
jgi:hypothetical protein